MAEFQMVPLSNLIECPLNPRRHFDPAKLQELADSMRGGLGVIEPLVVRLNDAAHRFEIVAGARRFRAAKLAQLETVPVVIRQLSDAAVLECMVVENGQRDDLEPLEEAAGFKRLLESDVAKYSPSFIADRIGRSEKYVWDRMRLLELIPEVKAHLEAERITVGHAVLIARLKPADQKRVLADGLFEHQGGLDFAGDAKREKCADLKAVTVRELESWIAHHVRFDVEHFAAAAPLEFGEAATQVQTAAAQPGRGKKVIPITFDHYLQPEARDAGERTYGPRAWKYADGEKHVGLYDGKAKLAPTCEHSVLGVVVAGGDYGETFRVCVARDKCEVHWQQEQKEKAKVQKARARGDGARADRAEQRAEERRRQQEAAEEAVRAQWRKAEGDLVEACAEKVKALKAKALIARGLARMSHTTDAQKHLGKVKTAEDVIRLMVLADVIDEFGEFQYERDRFTKQAKALGVDVAAIVKQHAPAKAKPQ